MLSHWDFEVVSYCNRTNSILTFKEVKINCMDLGYEVFYHRPIVGFLTFIFINFTLKVHEILCIRGGL